MAQHHLTEKEIQELLLQYEAEHRKLTYQLSQVSEVIGNLRASLLNVQQTVVEVEVPKKVVSVPQLPTAGSDAPSALPIQEKKAKLALSDAEAPNNGHQSQKIERRGRPRKGEEKSKPIESQEPKNFRKSVISPEMLETMLVNLVKREGRAVSSGEMLQMTLRSIEGTSLAAKDISHNISGTLFSLHNKRILIAVPHKTKAQVHALPKWLDANDQLLPEYDGANQ